MIRTASQQMANAIGKELGASDDVAQADLFNGFGSIFETVSNTEDRTDMQACYVADRLDVYGRAAILRIARFLEGDGGAL